MERYDLMSARARKDSDKPYWHKVGAAFKRDKGGYSLVFDSLPLPDKDGRVSLMMWAAKEKETSTPHPVSQVANNSSPDELDDEIPF